MIAVLLLLTGLVGLLAFWRRDNNYSQGKVNWGPFDAVSVTFFIYLYSQITLAIVIGLASLVNGNYDKTVNWFSENNYGNFVGVLLIEIVSFLLIINFLKRRKSSLAAIGLNRRPKLSDAGRAILAAIGYLVIFIVTLTLANKYIPSLNVDQKQELGFNNVSNMELPIVFISLVILPPLLEEIMARGVLYSGLKTKLSIPIAALITSIIFAVAHLQAGSGKPLLWVAAIDTFILSFVLVYLREKTGSLWSPIFLHALKNGVAFLTLFVFKLA